MDISDGILIGAIVVSLFIGLKSLCQTKNTQEKQSKNILLNEILDWTLNILRCEKEDPIVFSATELVSLSPEQNKQALELINLTNHVNWLRKYTALEAQSRSIKSIAKAFKNEELRNAIIDTTEKLQKHKEVLLLETTGKSPKTPALTKKYPKTRDELNQSAEILSDVVGNIKADLVGIKPKIGESKMRRKLRQVSTIGLIALGIAVIVIFRVYNAHISLLAIGISITALGYGVFTTDRSLVETATQIEKATKDITSEIKKLRKDIKKHLQSSKGS